MTMHTPNPLTKPGRLAAMTAFTLSLVALSGCLGGDDAQSASIGLYVKDDVTDDFAEVHVTYTSAQVLPEGAPDWVVAYEGERTIEMLSLSDSAAKEKLADLGVEPGPYDGLRIAVSQVEAIDHNGTSHALVVVGDLLQISESFEVGEEGLSLLVDFDLDAGVDARAGTFAPEAASLQRSDRDTDGDGIPDIDDADTDGDGIPDADDDDLDGDGMPDRPAQARHGYFGLCTAWYASEAGREHGNATNSSAFQHLQNESAAQNHTVEEFCDEQDFPGPPDAVPEEAQQAREDAMERREQRGAPDDAGSQGNQTGGPPDGQGNQTGSQGNQTGGPDGQGGQGGSGGLADSDPDGARDPDS